ncbi:MAG: PQQ-binding-like beta-propeller repeat protein, partial [Chloroflexi bacterium]|nr:PQQ-binding-like beta-propeller repeat protein [Chloroflexota bacterium]
YTADQDGARQIVWEHQIGETGSSNQYNVGFDKQQVYLSQGTSLQAFDRDDGSPLWETVLSDEVNFQCVSCIRPVKDRVIVLTADNILEAFDTHSGRSAWQVTLEDKTFSYPDAGQVAFAVVGDKVMLLDDVEIDGRAEAGLFFYDIESGERVQEIIPRCPDIDQFFDDDSISDDGQLFINEQTGDLITLFGTAFVSQMCLQKWNAHNGELIWETRLPEDIGAHSNVDEGLFTETSFSPFAVYTSDLLLTTLDISPDHPNAGIMQFDLTNGDILLQISDEDYQMTPIGRQGDVVLLLAEKQRGSKQFEIWGVDANSGERIWRHIIQADYLYEQDPFDDKFSYRLQPDGLILIQLLTDSDPANLTVQKLNTADGELLYDVENPVTDDYWSGLTWTPNNAYLILRALVGVDLQTGTAVQDWP